MARTEYVPDRRDVVLLDFEPTKGKEIGKYRPALVLSQSRLQPSLWASDLLSDQHQHPRRPKRGANRIPRPTVGRGRKPDPDTGLARAQGEEDCDRNAACLRDDLADAVTPPWGSGDPGRRVDPPSPKWRGFSNPPFRTLRRLSPIRHTGAFRRPEGGGRGLRPSERRGVGDCLRCVGRPKCVAGWEA